MSARKKRWVLRDSAPPELIAAFADQPPMITSLLYQRNLRDPHSITEFLAADYRSGLHDPFLMKGMPEAARRLAAAITNHEPIAVYGDFDTDGVTAAVLLVQALSAFGGDIQPYIPHRLREGYGLNAEAIDRLAAADVRLLITVDCGISNSSEVAHAQQRGIDVIVTDHHTPPDTLPNACAVVNPKQPGCAYPYKQLVGVGIAFKLVQALARLGLRAPALRGRDMLDMVALGTVADMGPLTGENRVLVKAGLESINTSRRPGLQALIDAAGLIQGQIGAADISFMLGPRLNAAGRLDDALLAYRLLLAEDADTARQLAAELNQANRRRQDLTKEIHSSARDRIQALGKHTNRIILLTDETYPAGLVGLVAARLVEDFGRPVLLLEQGPTNSRGSARSVPGFSIIDALTTCADLLVRFGGHSAAAGFTIANQNLPAFESQLLRYAEQHLPESLLSSAIEIDAELPLASLNWELLAQLGALEPFGQANPQPIFMSSRVRVVGAWPRGSEGQHLKLRIDDGNGGPAFDAIAFRLGSLATYFAAPRQIDIAYALEANEWNGSRTLQLNIKDLRRPQ